jgi:hypothetical protein
MNQFVQDTKSIPVSAMSLSTSYGAVTLRLGVPAPVSDGTGVIQGEIIAWKHQVPLSPTLAVQLHAMLGDAIAGWERQFGTIPRLALTHTFGGEARGPEQSAAKQTSVPCPACGQTGMVGSLFGRKMCNECAGEGYVDTTPAPGATLHSLEVERSKPRE